MTDSMRRVKENQKIENMAIVAEALKDLKKRAGLTEAGEKKQTKAVMSIAKENGKVGDFIMTAIPIELLNIDLTYQRTETFDVARANKMARSFQKSQLDPIHVSYRDGKFEIVDGQHRTYMFIILGREFITARIDEMTYKEEIKAFMHQHEDKKLSPYDLYKAGLAISDPVDTALKDLTEKYGVEIAATRSRNGVAKLQSITAAKDIICVEGIEALEWVFQLIHDTKWENEPSAYSSLILRTFKQVYNRYAGEMSNVYPTLVDYLNNMTPTSLLHNAKTSFPMRHDMSAMFTLIVTAIEDLRPVEKEAQNNVVPSVSGEDKVFVLKAQ